MTLCGKNQKLVQNNIDIVKRRHGVAKLEVIIFYCVFVFQTAYLPDREMYHQKKSEMLAMLDTLMAGRAAEELIFGSDCITSGAADDLRKASELAANMVKMYGMSDKVGLRYYGTDEGRDIFSAGKDVSPNAAEAIDMEIRRILQVRM